MLPKCDNNPGSAYLSDPCTVCNTSHTKPKRHKPSNPGATI